MTYRLEGNVWDMPGVIWRDILAAVMDSFPSAAPLEAIYEKNSAHQRAKTNPHWREKVRQTLQSYPALFASEERGVWARRRSVHFPAGNPVAARTSHQSVDRLC